MRDCCARATAASSTSIASRPEVRVVASVDGDEDATYAALLDALQEGEAT